MKRLVVATTNINKVAEVQSALSSLEDWEVVPLPSEIAGVEETGATFIENAILKAVHFSTHVEGLVLADDSGLCIDALGGRPGVRSARYASTSELRIRGVLDEMESVPDDQRQAAFICALALARTGEVIWTVEREVSGWITRAPSGTHGFGYDPVFLLPELGRTMAELTMEEKNLLSHRGRALAEFQRFLPSI